MKKLFKLIFVIMTITVLLGGFSGESFAQPQSQTQAPKTYIVLVDRVLPQDFLQYGGESLQHILENSAWGILSNTTARGKSTENQAMTIGSGSRALAPYGVYFFNTGENYEGIYAETIYKTFNNRELTDEMVFNPYIQNIIYNNGQLNHTVEVGIMGELLKEEGLKRVVLGNSDDFEIKRQGSAILMDSEGIIDYGIIDERILKENSKFPGGFSTNYQVMVDYLEQYQGRGDVFLLDTGDTHRLDEYYRFYQPEEFEELRAKTILEMDYLFESILNSMGQDDQLFLVTLNAPYSMREEGENVPVVYHYNKNTTGSLLTAPSTKRPGVVTTLDLAPTILSNYGIEAAAMYGSLITHLEEEDHTGTLLARLHQINTVFNQRPLAIRIFIVITIIIVTAFIVNLKLDSIPQEWFSYLILMAMAGPLSFLIMPIFGPLPLVFYLFVFYVICILVAYVIRRFVKEPIHGVIALSAVTVGSVLVDTLFNSYLQKQSILGYDVIAGARFYGVGNEYMGVIIGGSIIATLPLMFNPKHKKWLYLIYGATTFIMMAPFFGTNFGGTLSLAVTFGVALTDIKKGKGLTKYVLALGGIFALAVGAMLVMNIFSQDQTHIGRLFAGDNVNRLEEILLAVTRKLSMNWRLVRFSIWSRIFGVLLVSTIIIGFYPPKKFEFLKEKHYYRGVKAILAGSLAALFLNDSGIVAAATAMLFLALPILYVFCLDKSESTSSHLK